jgi:peptidoglycan/xylan/chitin deacetylase (PgdA/CDA1 family)
MCVPKTRLQRVLRYAAIRGGLELVSLIRALGVGPAAGGRGVIFTLHHVRPASERVFGPNAHLSVTPEFLSEAIIVALGCGLAPVALEELPRLLADPAETRKFVCFTLDDGYRDNARHAAPVFRRHGVPYTVFVSTGLVERTRTLWWETADFLTREVTHFTFDFGTGSERVVCDTPRRKCAAFDRLRRFVDTIDEDEAIARIDAVARAEGIEPMSLVDDLVMTPDELRALTADPLVRLGAHTRTHVNLRRVSPERLAGEVVESGRAIAEWVGRSPHEFCYPYGWQVAVGEREIRAVRDAGYTVAVTTRPGVLNYAGPEDLLTLARISLNGLYQHPRHVRALVSGMPFHFV